MSRLKDIWRHNKLMFIAFVLAAALTLMFLVRTVVFTLYWADPAHRDQSIEPWMTIRYVSYSWDLPRDEMIAALGFQPENGRLQTFGEIAQSRGLSLEDITARIEAAAKDYRAQQK